MNRKVWTYFIIICFLGFFGGFAIVFLVPWDFSDEIAAERREFVDDIRKQQISIEQLADLLSACPDSSYYGQYLAKSSRFNIYPILNDTIAWNFPKRDNSFCLEGVLPLAAKIDVRNVWNNKAANHYKLELSQGAYWLPTVYVSKQKKDTALRLEEAADMKKISHRVYLELSRINEFY